MSKISLLLFFKCRFPLNNPDILAKWKTAVKRLDSSGKPWVPGKGSSLCSDHFLESDFQFRPGADRKLLKLGAVPSVFLAFPDHLQVFEECK